MQECLARPITRCEPECVTGFHSTPCQLPSLSCSHHVGSPALAILEPFYSYWAKLGALGGTLFPRLALNSTASSHDT